MTSTDMEQEPDKDPRIAEAEQALEATIRDAAQAQSDWARAVSDAQEHLAEIHRKVTGTD